MKRDFKTYGQCIHNTRSNSIHSVEFLTRPKDNIQINVEEMFRLSDDKALADWFLHQQRQAIEFYNRTGVEPHVNIDLGAFKYIYDNNLFTAQDQRVTFTMELTQIHGYPTVQYVDCIKSCDKFKQVKCALDDYDINNVLYENLEGYDFDMIKIDKSLLNRAEHSREVYDHLIELQKKYPECEFVVEGVETRYQVDMLEKMGFHLFQGYFFHRPEELESLSSRLKK